MKCQGYGDRVKEHTVLSRLEAVCQGVWNEEQSFIEDGDLKLVNLCADSHPKNQTGMVACWMEGLKFYFHLIKIYALKHTSLQLASSLIFCYNVLGGGTNAKG